MLDKMFILGTLVADDTDTAASSLAAYIRKLSDEKEFETAIFMIIRIAKMRGVEIASIRAKKQADRELEKCQDLTELLII